MPYQLMSALAAEHAADLHRSAERRRLSALARCCQPAVLLALARRMRLALTGHHRPVIRAACCA